jgi:HK97 family phage portal protein
MIFRSSNERRIRNDYQIDTGPGGWNDLKSWLGISTDDLHVHGTQSLKEITVYTCIKILSETLGKLPLKIYQDTPDGKQKAAKHYLYPLLKLRPNPYMSSVDFFRVLEVMRNTHGNAYAWMDIDPRSGLIKGFYPLNSSQMLIYVDDRGLLSSKDTVWYIYTDRTGQQYRISADNLLHFKGLTTDGLAGLSVIETLRSTIENSKAASTFLNNAYKGGMTTKGIVHYTGELDGKAETTFRTNWEKMSNGLSNANRISLLPFGYQYQPIEMKMTDAQFLENTRLTIQQLTAAYGIKPHQVNDQTKTSYASVSEANREFYTDTLLAILAIYEQEFSYKVFTPSEIANGFYSKFNADVILRGDFKNRMDSYQVGINNGVLTPNEARDKEDMEPLDGGDQLLGNGNLTPLTLIAKGTNYTKKTGGQ